MPIGSEIANLFVRISADTRELLSGLDKASSATRKFGTDLRRVGTELTAGVTLPIVAVGGAAVKMASSFEAEMTRVSTLAGATTEEVAKLSQEVLELAPQVGKGPQELASALYFTVSGGIAAADAMEVVTAAAQAAAAGLGETQVIADAVSSVMNAYGAANISAAEATSILISTVKFGKGEPAEMAGSLGRVVSIANQAGVSFAQVGGFIATFTRLGVDANEATTALRGALLGIVAPTEQAKKQMAALGFSAESLQQSIKDKGLAATLIEMVQATGGNTEAMSELIPNVRALAGVMGVTGEQAESFRAIEQGIAADTEALSETFAGTTQTFEFMFNQLKAGASALVVSLGLELLPILKDFKPEFDKAIEAVRRLVGRFRDLDPETKKIVVVLAAAAAAAGPLLVVLGTMVITIGALLNPVGLVVGALAALSAAAVVAYQKNEAFRDLIKGLAPVFQAALASVKTFANIVKTVLGAALSVIINMVGLVVNLLSGDWAQAWQNARNVLGALPIAVMDIAKAIIDGFIDAFEKRFTEMVKPVVALRDRVVGIFEDMRRVIVGQSEVPDMVDEVIAEFLRQHQEVVPLVQRTEVEVVGSYEEMNRAARELDVAPIVIAEFEEQRRGVEEEQAKTREAVNESYRQMGLDAELFRALKDPVVEAFMLRYKHSSGTMKLLADEVVEKDRIIKVSGGELARALEEGSIKIFKSYDTIAEAATTAATAVKQASDEARSSIATIAGVPAEIASLTPVALERRGGAAGLRSGSPKAVAAMTKALQEAAPAAAAVEQGINGIGAATKAATTPLQSLMQQLKEAAETTGLNQQALLEYRLEVLGATPEQIELALAYQEAAINAAASAEALQRHDEAVAEGRKDIKNFTKELTRVPLADMKAGTERWTKSYRDNSLAQRANQDLLAEGTRVAAESTEVMGELTDGIGEVGEGFTESGEVIVDWKDEMMKVADAITDGFATRVQDAFSGMSTIVGKVFGKGGTGIMSKVGGFASNLLTMAGPAGAIGSAVFAIGDLFGIDLKGAVTKALSKIGVAIGKFFTSLGKAFGIGGHSPLPAKEFELFGRDLEKTVDGTFTDSFQRADARIKALATDFRAVINDVVIAWDEGLIELGLSAEGVPEDWRAIATAAEQLVKAGLAPEEIEEFFHDVVNASAPLQEQVDAFLEGLDEWRAAGQDVDALGGAFEKLLRIGLDTGELLVADAARIQDAWADATTRLEKEAVLEELQEAVLQRPFEALLDEARAAGRITSDQALDMFEAFADASVGGMLDMIAALRRLLEEEVKAFEGDVGEMDVELELDVEPFDVDSLDLEPLELDGNTRGAATAAAVVPTVTVENHVYIDGRELSKLLEERIVPRIYTKTGLFTK